MDTKTEIETIMYGIAGCISHNAHKYGIAIDRMPWDNIEALAACHPALGLNLSYAEAANVLGVTEICIEERIRRAYAQFPELRKSASETRREQYRELHAVSLDTDLPADLSENEILHKF